MNKFIKNQISQLKPSATLAINEESNKLKKSGKKVYKFGFGQSPFPIPETIVSALKTNAEKHTYLPMQGLEELRLAIANYLNKNNNNDFRKEDIVVGPGTKELMFLMQIVFQGEVLLPAPSWVSYQPQALIAKNKVHWIQTTSNSNWFPTAEQIENKIKSIKNKNFLLFINSPNNPSGTVCKNLHEIAETKEQESNQIIEFTREIKKNSMEFRLKIIEILWKIVYSDGTNDNYESSLIRRVCGLLYVSDRDSGMIKLKIKNSIKN